MTHSHLKPSILFILLCFTTVPAYTEESSQKKVAQILISEGNVSAYSNDPTQRHPLSRGNDIFEDEWIEIGPQSRADVKVADGSVISFLENSKYHFINIDTDPTHPENYKNVASITQGGLKVISGQLSKLNPKGYELKTPVATIGIRGTEFIVSIPEKNVVNVSVSRGSVALTQYNASFISQGFVSKVSKELVTTLNSGDAIRATPRTAMNIPPQEVYGYDGLKVRALEVQEVQPTHTNTSSQQPGKNNTQAPVGPQGSQGKPSGQESVKPAADSAFCHAL